MQTPSASPPPSTSADRQTCWLARDFYLTCLNYSITSESLYNHLKADGTEEIVPKGLRSVECDKLRKDMYDKCPLSWAEHFEKKFRGDKLKEFQMTKLKVIGAQPL